MQEAANSKQTSQSTYLKVAALGSTAGLLNESVLHPIDTIRTRLKSNTQTYMPFFGQISKMYQKEGVTSYFRGFTCTLFGAIAANGVYFYIYEKLKHSMKKAEWLPSYISPFIAGFVAGLTSDVIILPFDVTRTRMQLEPGTYNYRNAFDGIRKIVKYEGFRTLYLGAPVFFPLSALFSGLMFGFYELFYKTGKHIMKCDKEVNVSISVVSSVWAAALAAIVTNPLDVLLTRMQSVDTTVQERYTIKTLVKKMYKNEGLSGFMKGVTGTVTYYAVASAILFPTYEVLKSVFNVDLSDEEMLDM